MTLDDVNRLFAYWQTYPPLRDLVASFIGFKPEPARDPDDTAKPAKFMTADDMRALLAASGGYVPGMT